MELMDKLIKTIMIQNNFKQIQDIIIIYIYNVVKITVFYKGTFIGPKQWIQIINNKITLNKKTTFIEFLFTYININTFFVINCNLTASSKFLSFLI